MSVLIETNVGDIVVDLFTDQCPIASLNFLKLCKLKRYNNCIFFNVQRDFIAQTGDPTNTGKGGVSLQGLLSRDKTITFPDEIHDSIKCERAGMLVMANVGPDTNQSQFFFTARAGIDYLDGKHTIFGEIAEEEGLQVLMKINEAYCDDKNRPYRNIRIRHTIVLEDPYPDPPGLTEPEGSPEPMRDVRAEADDPDPNAGRTQLEIEREMAAKEAKSRAIVLEMVGDLPDADIVVPDNVLFVCKLNPATEDADLEIIFSRFGAVKSADIIRDFKTGQSLNYAFIEFETREACELAYEKMNNVLIDDRRIKVDFSQSVAKQWKQFKLQNREKQQARRKERGLEAAASGLVPSQAPSFGGNRPYEMRRGDDGQLVEEGFKHDSSSSRGKRTRDDDADRERGTVNKWGRDDHLRDSRGSGGGRRDDRDRDRDSHRDRDRDEKRHHHRDDDRRRDDRRDDRRSERSGSSRDDRRDRDRDDRRDRDRDRDRR